MGGGPPVLLTKTSTAPSLDSMAVRFARSLRNGMADCFGESIFFQVGSKALLTFGDGPQSRMGTHPNDAYTFITC